MPDKTFHMIQSQKVEVEFENPKDVFECRNHLSEVCKYRLIPAIEMLFDEKSDKKSTISISKLELDVGKLAKKDWESNFVESVIAQLRNYLDKAIAVSGDNKVNVRHRAIPYDIADNGENARQQSGFNDEPLINDEGRIKSDGFLITRAESKQSEQLLFYLKTGLLTWNTSIERKEDLKKGMVNLLTTDNVFSKNVEQLILFNPKALGRLVYLLPEKAIYPIFEKEDWNVAEIRKLKETWDGIFQYIELPETKNATVFFQALACLYKTENPGKLILSEALSREIVRLLETNHQRAFGKLVDLPKSYLSNIPQKGIGSLLGKPIKGTKGKGKVKTKFDKRETDPEPKIEPDVVYILNSGLVLLHPFLSSLFENVGHTNQNNWSSEELQQRSVLLTQYLIKGTDDYAEHEMYLNKILTGFPLDEPLPINIELSDFEKSEADDLLRSVIDHWQALKNTSIAALQTTFLQRAGKIEKNDTGWLLQVEQKGFDVLLDKIPWGFSTIKTPWMQGLLNVEWV